MPEFFFLTGDERQKFETPGRVIARRISQELPREDSGTSVPLIQDLLRRVDAQIKRGQAKGVLGHWFEGMVVTVQPRDGMSWTAEATARAYVAAYPTVRVWAIADSPPPDDLPAVAHQVGTSWFLTAAARRGLADPFLTWRSWQALVALGVVFTLGVIAQFAGDEPVKGAAVTGRSLTWAVGTVIFAITGLLLRNWLGTQTRANALKSFVDRGRRSEASDAFGQLVDDVARRLQAGPFPRLVVIENYQTVDRLTQEAIERYFSEFADGASGSETWVIFEPPGAARLARRVSERRRADEPHGRGYRGMSLWSQQFLNAEERRYLLEKLDRTVEASVGLAAVKLLCEGVGDGVEIHTIASEHRKVTPRGEKGYTALDLLFFVSMTTTRLRLSPARLLNRLLDQTPRRSKILPAVFRVRQLRKDDIRFHLDQLPTLFPTLVHREGSGMKAILAIGADVTAALTQHHGELDLPDPALAHAFWAMYWYDDVFNTAKADEAFWIREIAAHLSQAGLSALDRPSVQDELASQLYDVAHFAAKACLRVGLFEEVAPLLQRCTDYLSGTPAVAAAHRPAILRTAWEAYSVFGDDALLSVILENTDTGGPTESEHVPADIRLFLDSLSLSPDARARLGPALADGYLTRRAQEMADYARVRSGWFAQSALRRAQPVPRLQLHDIGSLALGDSVRSAAARLSPDRAQPLLIDLLTLNGGLWCLAEHPAAAVRALSADGLIPFLPKLEGSALPQIARLFAALSVKEVADLSETAALIASDLRSREFSRKLETNFLREALTVDVSVTALAACVAAVLQARKAGNDVVTEETFGLIRGVRDIVCKTLSYDLPPLAGPESLSAPPFLAGVDDLLRMCALVWRKMGVPQLGAFVLIRRLAFRSIAGLHEGGGAPDTLFEMVNALAARVDYVGLITNLELADHHQRAAEISSHFLDQAARAAIAGEMGDLVRQDLALMALFGHHAVGGDPTALVAELARLEFSALRQGLAGIPPDNLSGTMLALLNIGKRVAPAPLSAAWRHELDAFAATITDASHREEIERLIEVSALRSEGMPPAEVGRLLDRWQPHKTLWLYPWLLEVLLWTGHDTDRILNEAESVCARAADRDEFNTWLLLALAIADYADGRSAVTPPAVVQYLENAAPKWAARLTAHVNLRMYTALAKAGGPHASTYHAERIRWQQVEIEYHHLRTLPQLAGRREFFLLFFEYFDLMAAWGLALDGSVAFKVRMNADEHRRKQELAVWRPRLAGLVPVRDSNGIPVVSSDFLCLGLYLSRPPLDSDDACEEDRQIINALARRYLPKLLESIRTMRDVPPFISQVFDRHSRRLEHILAAA